MRLTFIPMDQSAAAHFRSGGADAYGNAPERFVSDGDGVPCRCCMRMIGSGEAYLLLAWRPFSTRHAFSETGPVFVHAEPCESGTPAEGTLPAFLERADYILRGYDTDERIVYGSGGIIARDHILDRAARLLADPRIASVHVRSSRNNCYHWRIVPETENPPA
ncbi:uncharacterized protein DUF1203 [Hoeflea marina]|uniref:Uncharacterized protein DUF1203 n=1 Tax=Hoeflea marina TaxID=274592 RepID=A0A317PU83_9HYPH|nr:DUF1203 domain-containing protein [Hoeflea marina]PWW04234.1 uncharacterized protein DUF1203 [Hoeflea marina]